MHSLLCCNSGAHFLAELAGVYLALSRVPSQDVCMPMLRPDFQLCSIVSGSTQPLPRFPAGAAQASLSGTGRWCLSVAASLADSFCHLISVCKELDVFPHQCFSVLVHNLHAICTHIARGHSDACLGGQLDHLRHFPRRGILRVLVEKVSASTNLFHVQLNAESDVFLCIFLFFCRPYWISILSSQILQARKWCARRRAYQHERLGGFHKCSYSTFHFTLPEVPRLPRKWVV